MAPHRVSAQLTFASSEMGGLQAAMNNPTPSLILLFASLDEDSAAMEAEQQLGAIVDTGRPNIQPGDTGLATLTFWSDLGRIYATPGSAFRLWYAGRIVGDGLVVEEIPLCL